MVRHDFNGHDQQCPESISDLFRCLHHGAIPRTAPNVGVPLGDQLVYRRMAVSSHQFLNYQCFEILEFVSHRLCHYRRF
jgi:hypothetical protein